MAAAGTEDDGDDIVVVVATNWCRELRRKHQPKTSFAARQGRRTRVRAIPIRNVPSFNELGSGLGHAPRVLVVRHDHKVLRWRDAPRESDH